MNVVIRAFLLGYNDSYSQARAAFERGERAQMPRIFDLLPGGGRGLKEGGFHDAPRSWWDWD